MRKEIWRFVLGIAITAGVIVGAWYIQTVAIPASREAMTTAEAGEKPVEMVVLMYHSINSKRSRAGDYVITPEALKSDLEWLGKNGYQTVVMADLLAYVREGTPLPQKPVMITFDDGYYNNYLHLFPLLKQFGMKAVISIIGTETDKFSAVEENNENYSHLTWKQIEEMMDSGLVEFQNHSYNLHKASGARKGIGKNKGEDTQKYQNAIHTDIAKAQERYKEMTGWTPTTFAYPFGTVSKDSYPVLRELGFSASLDVQGRVYQLTRDPQCLWRIPRYNRPWGTTAEQIIKRAEKS